jgi:hypothetical protein
MRSLGEFFGHIVRAVKSDPNRRIISKAVEQENRGDLTLRRTTIEEVEIRRSRDGEEPS